MSAEKHYSRLGIKIFQQSDFAAALQRNPYHKDVIEFQRIFQQYVECGDLDSTEAFYHFAYPTVVPSLNTTFIDIFQSFDYPLDVVLLPEMRRFCNGATSVLDAGCGSGLVLTYLASELPKAQFVGIDRLPEPVAESQLRITEFGLSNASVAIGDAFALPTKFKGQFECVLLRNIVDDSRRSYTQYLDAEFDTVRKLTEAGKALTHNGRIWLSMTPFPHYTPEFQSRVETAIEEAGFGVIQSQQIPYNVSAGRFIHLTIELSLRCKS